MRHATLEELLARRDGEPLSPEVDRHVDRCQTCSAELERLHQTRAQLKALAAPAPPRDRWPAVRDAIVAEQRSQRRRRNLTFASVAAALLLAVFGFRGALERQALEAERDELRTTLAVLMEHSQLLESELVSLRTQSRVQTGWRAQAIVELEDLLETVDGDLDRIYGDGEPTPDAVALWRDRLEIQDALLRVHVEPTSHRGI